MAGWRAESWRAWLLRMSDSKPLATGADWTQLLADPDLVSHLGKLLKVCREVSPENREKALFDAIREIKQGAGSKPASKGAAAGVAEPAASPVLTATATAPPFEPDIFTPSWGEDRRRYPRMKCFVAVELRVENDSSPVWGNLSNTSLGGCLVETGSIVNEGKKIEIGLWVANGKIWVKGIILTGVVTGNKSSQGLRIKFGEMETSEREALRHFLKFVENTTKSYHQDHGYLAQMKR
jgi:PilZ domain